jgi:eukaryotic-like serine/threonine-protein kinase
MILNRDEVQALLAEALREKYEILRWIGGGGMAQVFLARHRVHGARFAVKVLNVDLAQDERILARFLEEARTAVTLAGHPNIVEVFDVCTENGLSFLIMQYVEGEDLAAYLEAHKPLPPDTAVEIILQVADALSWAASKGVVHRDLKPSNLYLNQRGRVMILDFGIAKAADSPSQLTLPPERLGTPYYMSPEQIRGSQCDTRSDLYSLGVVFFELLAGRKPFEGDSNRTIQNAHLESPLPDLRSINPAVPAYLIRVVEKLLAKSADERYQSPKQLITDLNGYGTQVDPVPTNGGFKYKTGVIAAVALILILAAGGLFIRGLFKPKPDRHPVIPSTIKDKLGERMLLIPAGEFIFGDDDPGSPNEKQTVNIGSFYIDETEVSNRYYRRFCEETGHNPPSSESFSKNPNLPVTNVSFEDAELYARWLGKRLPSEKEWEKAARGTDGRTYPWGNEIWTDPPTTIQPVLSCPMRVSPYGAYNMAGNVTEWTTSHYQIGDPEIRDMTQLLGTSRFSRRWRVIKGGYFGPKPDAQRAWKTYMRRGFPEDISVSPLIGFRCVSDLK